MTIQQLLEKLTLKRDALDAAISEILNAQSASTVRRKATAIIKSAKGFKYTRKKPHWMQLPENRAKVIQMAKDRAKKRREKK